MSDPLPGCRESVIISYHFNWLLKTMNQTGLNSQFPGHGPWGWAWGGA